MSEVEVKDASEMESNADNTSEGDNKAMAPGDTSTALPILAGASTAPAAYYDLTSSNDLPTSIMTTSVATASTTTMGLPMTDLLGTKITVMFTY